MADWTANSDFGAPGARREPVVRATREAAPRTEAPRAERFAAVRPQEEDEAPRSASAALAEYNAAQDGPLAKARLAVWVGGGVVSLALIAVTGVWGYKLVLREVMGLPVVEAAEGPMRMAPADPGGELVPQQGLAVNAIPAAGTAAPPSDVLMLAPQTPGLAEEDMEVVQTMAEAGEVNPAAAPVVASAAAVATGALPPAEAAPAPVPAVAAPAVAAPAEPAAIPAIPAESAAVPAGSVAAVTPAEPAPATQAAPANLVSALLPTDRPMTTEEILAFADQIARQSASPAAPAPAPPASAEVAALVAAAPVAAAPLRPQPRPAAPAAAPATTEAAPVTAAPTSAEAVPAATAPEVALAEAAPAEAAAPAATLTASLPAGTHLIQLGAFDSAEIAASEWTRLQGAFGEFLGAKERVIQETQSGGRTLYRLRATGFADRADARRLCAALTAEGADCLPVTVD